MAETARGPGTTLLGAYCLATQLAGRDLFLPPADRPANDLRVFDFALHFDASRFAGLERLLSLFPDTACDPCLAATYNRQSVLEFERIRDFLLLHYLPNQRHGEPFWDHIRAIPPTDGLQVKLDAWRSGGEFVRNEWDTFQDPSWLSLYAGFGDLPARHSPLADRFDHATLGDSLTRMRAAIDATLKLAERHQAFLARVLNGDARVG